MTCIRLQSALHPPAGFACLDLTSNGTDSLDSQQLKQVLTACIGKDRSGLQLQPQNTTLLCSVYDDMHDRVHAGAGLIIMFLCCL